MASTRYTALVKRRLGTMLPTTQPTITVSPEKENAALSAICHSDNILFESSVASSVPEPIVGVNFASGFAGPLERPKGKTVTPSAATTA